MAQLWWCSSGITVELWLTCVCDLEKTSALYNPITSYNFLYTAHYLADVTEQLSRLSKMCQKRILDFTDVNPLFESITETIKDLKSSKCGYTLRKFLSSSPKEPTTDEHGLTTFQFGVFLPRPRLFRGICDFPLICWQEGSERTQNIAVKQRCCSVCNQAWMTVSKCSSSG